MSKNNISELDVIAANNADLAGISILGTGLLSTADDSFRTAASFLAKWWDDIGGVNTVGGTGDAITVTTATIYTALKTGMRLQFIASAANTTAATLNLDAIGAKALRKISGGTDVALVAGDIPGAKFRVEVGYDAAANSAAGAWIVLGAAPVSSATTSAQGIVNLSQLTGPYNLALAASVGSSALTISLKGVDGNDPSASNPVYIPFRNVTAGTGTPTWLTVTAATSIVVSSGSTLGMTSAVAATLAIVAFNDAGTFRLGIVNPLALPLADGIASSTAEGGAGASDSAGVIYTGTAVASKAMTVLGYAVATEATAGTWATAPATLKVASAAEVAATVLPIITPWVAYTPTFTGYGTATGVEFWSRRVGDSLEIQGRFTCGTTTATEARITLGFNGTNSNVTSSSTKITSIREVGGGTLATAISGVAFYPLIESNVGYLTVGIQTASSAGLSKSLGTGVSTGVTLSINATVPIAGW